MVQEGCAIIISTYYIVAYSTGILMWVSMTNISYVIIVHVRASSGHS